MEPGILKAEEVYKCTSARAPAYVNETDKYRLYKLAHSMERKDFMGCLWVRDCNHCKNLFDAMTMGVCMVTDHTVEFVGDGEYARECPDYENRWGYEEREGQ